MTKNFNQFSVEFSTGTDTSSAMNTKSDGALLQRVEFFCNTINHVVIGFVAIYMSWMCIRLDLQATALHAWLCTIGYNLLMAEALMCHYSGNVLTFSYSRKTKTTIHWVLQVLGGGMGIAGIAVKIDAKTTHFTTVHGKLGLASLILCCLSMITGLSALYSQNVKKLLKPILNKAFHNFVGLAAFVVGMVAMYYGYNTGFFARKVTPDFKVLMKVLTIWALVFSAYSSTKALIEKCINFFN